MVVTIIVVKTEVGILLEVVVVGNENQVRAILLLRFGIIHSSTHGRAKLEVGIHARVIHIRAVGREATLHLLTQRVLVVVLTAQTVLIDILPAPTDLRTTQRLPQPAVGDIDLVCLGQIAETIVIAVVRLRIHRAVCQDHGR